VPETLKSQAPLGSDISYVSEVAIETSGDLPLVGPQSYPAFALPAIHDQELVFEEKRLRN
jgi:hypothetical protein